MLFSDKPYLICQIVIDVLSQKFLLAERLIAAWVEKALCCFCSTFLRALGPSKNSNTLKIRIQQVPGTPSCKNNRLLVEHSCCRDTTSPGLDLQPREETHGENNVGAHSRPCSSTHCLRWRWMPTRTGVASGPAPTRWPVTAAAAAAHSAWASWSDQHLREEHVGTSQLVCRNSSCQQFSSAGCRCFGSHLHISIFYF